MNNMISPDKQQANLRGLRHQTKYSIFGRSELSQFIVCVRLGSERLGKLGFNRLMLIRLRSS